MRIENIGPDEVQVGDEVAGHGVVEHVLGHVIVVRAYSGLVRAYGWVDVGKLLDIVECPSDYSTAAVIAAHFMGMVLTLTAGCLALAAVLLFVLGVIHVPWLAAAIVFVAAVISTVYLIGVEENE